MARNSTFKVAKTACANCLFGPDALVSPDRRREILKKCSRRGGHFICHLSEPLTRPGVPVNVCCRGFFDAFPGETIAMRLARLFDLVEEVDLPPMDEPLAPWRGLDR